MRVSHDYIFKDVAIAFPDNLASLVLPDLAEQIHLSGIEFVPGQERFNPLLPGRRWYPDLVADVRNRSGPESRALAHVEIEYAFRRRGIQRLRDYNHVIALETGLLVHTAVIYLHGGSRGLKLKEHRDVSFGCHLRTFRYHSLGLSRASAPDYLRRPEPLAWAFAILMSPMGIGSRAELAMACLRRILEARELDDGRRSKLLNFVQTYVRLDHTTAPEYQVLLRETENQEIREMMMTYADQLKAEGREEGREEGRVEGRVEAVQSLQDVVLDLLSQRFGRISGPIRRHVASLTSLDELKNLAKSVPRLESLEELQIG